MKDIRKWYLQCVECDILINLSRKNNMIEHDREDERRWIRRYGYNIIYIYMKKEIGYA